MKLEQNYICILQIVKRLLQARFLHVVLSYYRCKPSCYDKRALTLVTCHEVCFKTKTEQKQNNIKDHKSEGNKTQKPTTQVLILWMILFWR